MKRGELTNKRVGQLKISGVKYRDKRIKSKRGGLKTLKI